MNASNQTSLSNPVRPVLSKGSRFWRSTGWPLIALGLSIMAIGVVRSQLIPISFAGGAPIDETFHFGRVLDTLTLLNRLGLGSSGPRLQAEFHTANPMYLPRDPPPAYAFDDYWQSIGFYVGQAMVQVAAPGLSLVERLYLARLVNICFQVILAGMAYVASVNVFRNHRIALVLAGLLSFIPTLGTSAASVTTEVWAFVACLLLFAALANLYRNGWSGKTAAWLMIGALACLLTKNTSWPLIAVVIFMIFRRASVPGFVFLAGILLIMAGTVTQFSPQGAAHWYRDLLPAEAWEGYDTTLGVVDSHISQLGHQSLRLTTTYAERPLIQPVSESTLANLRGQRVTIGSWVRAPKGTAIILPVIQYAQRGGLFTTISQPVPAIIASGDWQFAQSRGVLPSAADYARIALWQNSESETSVWYDGLVMVAGDFPDNTQPQFSNDAATDGVWNGRTFVNLLQNGSGESQWWGVDSSRWTIEFPVNQRLFAWQDGSRTASAYLTAARAIFVTLWGSLQNDFPGLARWQLTAISIILFLGLATCLYYQLRPSKKLDQRAIPAWVVECLFIWLGVYVVMGLVRADVSGAWADPFFYASGRFLIPALFPVLGLTLTGLSGWLPRPQRNWILAGLVAALFLLNLWMLLKVEWPYYHCPTSPRWSCIATLY